VASPAPKIFTSVEGLETFSTRYFLEFKDREGRMRSVEITPELYSRIRGPYNRRNVYGAVLAFGPVLSTKPQTRMMFESVVRSALCGEAPLLVELDIDSSQMAGDPQIRLVPSPNSSTGNLPLVLHADCK